jgi:ankyrin repeat protein
MPLYYVSLCSFRDLVGCLLALHSPDVNSKGGFHTTPLHATTVRGHVEVASLLLQGSADPNPRDILGRVPLHRVSQGGQLVAEQSSLEIVWLLTNSGANVNTTDNDGCTPLHAAAQGGYCDITELLLGSGASCDAQSNDQETAVHRACLHGRLEVSRFLILIMDTNMPVIYCTNCGTQI